MTPDDAPLLPSHPWKTSYRHEDGDLIALFYVPALECAVRYDRTTGYFSADALGLAARGIERLIANGGRMRLVVGCTLDEDEVQAIEQGYELRSVIEGRLLRVSLDPPDLRAENGLAALAWLVAQGRLDVKVAVPADDEGRPTSGGIFHEKVGIITDRAGNRLGFSGSNNETAGGWLRNRESFHVHCAWESEREAAHVHDEVEAFERLWSDRSKSLRIVPFPEAAKETLLRHLPTDGRFDRLASGATPEASEEPFRLTPPSTATTRRLPFPDQDRGKVPTAAQPGTEAGVGSTAEREGPDPSPSSEESDNGTVADPPAARLMPDDLRRLVWAYVRDAPRMWNGIRVGEVTSAITPWPHQLRSFVRMYEGWPCRLLIADEVGLGKTISAGLLIRQAWLSGRARRILLMVPAGVLPQWQAELYEKFNLNVPIYDGQKLVWRRAYGRLGPVERVVTRAEWHKEPLVLCSSHMMRRRDRAAELLEAEDWDLIVLDEAHHARRQSPGSAQEGGPNRLLRLMQQLREKAESLVLLTATPMQVHPVEIWDLLNLLGLPPRWAASREEFVRYFQLTGGSPSHAEMDHLAEMFRDVENHFGPVEEGDVAKIASDISRLTQRKVLKALRDRSGIPLKRLGVDARRAALEILRRFSPIRNLMSRHTRELLRHYYRAGMLDSPIADRDVRDIVIGLSDAERALYDEVEDYIGTTYNSAAREERSAVGFVMTIYRRRLASSFYALKRTLTKRLSDPELAVDDEDVSQDERADEVMDRDEAADLSRQGHLAEERASINSLLRRIAQLGTDTKARRLKEHIEHAFTDGYESAIVFTQYTDTIDYLRSHLGDEFPGLSMACYSGRGGEYRDAGGRWVECTREQIKRRVKDGSIRLMLCTDAAAEGLNFQTCGVVINVDLPWNPMKVEQRIGRIDRIGQRHRTIRVVNFAYADTVEADVYFALSRRINLFQGIVGRLQPILSRLPQEFERVALERREHRESARHQLVAETERLVSETEAEGFDVDEVAREGVEMPALPPPALTLDELDAALNDPALRPPSVEWERLDPGSYKVRLPGMTDWVRITTSAAVFDEHFESHGFLSPGGELFKRITEEVAGAADEPFPSYCALPLIVEQQGTALTWSVREAETERLECLKDVIDFLCRGSPRRQGSNPALD